MEGNIGGWRDELWMDPNKRIQMWGYKDSNKRNKRSRIVGIKSVE